MLTLASASELFVSPGSTSPLRRQTICHGPMPEIAVLKFTGSPVQRTVSASGVAEINWGTMSLAEFVTRPQRPLTSTE